MNPSADDTQQAISFPQESRFIIGKTVNGKLFLGYAAVFFNAPDAPSPAMIWEHDSLTFSFTDNFGTQSYRPFIMNRSYAIIGNTSYTDTLYEIISDMESRGKNIIPGTVFRSARNALLRKFHKDPDHAKTSYAPSSIAGIVLQDHSRGGVQRIVYDADLPTDFHPMILSDSGSILVRLYSSTESKVSDFSIALAKVNSVQDIESFIRENVRANTLLNDRSNHYCIATAAIFFNTKTDYDVSYHSV